MNAPRPQLIQSVFSPERKLTAPEFALPPGMNFNSQQQMDGEAFLAALPEGSVPVAFLDPQYRGVMDKLAYGNEGQTRGRRRHALPQMPRDVIAQFIRAIDRALIPSGHLFLWIDKFHLCDGTAEWICDTQLAVVDLVTWDKGSFGMGYRTRRRAEYCLVLQKAPRRAKGVWHVHNIPDVVLEQVRQRTHPHAKPIGLQGRLLAAVSNPGDVVIDPAAGSYSVLLAARAQQRNFLGCDIQPTGQLPLVEGAATHLAASA